MAEYSDLAYALSGYGAPKNPYDRRRQYGYQLLQAGSDTSPILSPWQGAARLAQALAGGADLAVTDMQEKSDQKKRTDALAAAMAEPDPQKRIGLLAAYDPDKGATAAGQLAVEQAKLQQQQAGLGTLANGYGQPSGVPQTASPSGGSLPSAIAGIESGGQPNGGYGAVGPVANQQGNRAYGKYQVLDSNIGPWTKEILGQEMSPQQFLQSPQAQDAVAKAKIAQYVQQYGQEGAARAWFGGPGNVNNPTASDVNGMTVGQYGQRAVNGIQPIPNATGVGVPQPIPNAVPGQAQAIPAAGPQPQPGTPPAPSPQGVNGPTMTAPQVPQKMTVHTAPPEMLAPYIQKLRNGGYGLDSGTADQRMRADIQGEFDRKYEADKLGYEQKYGDYMAQRNNALQQPQNTVQNESKMREQLDTLQTVKDYRKSSAIFSNAINAAKDPTRAGDLNLVYSFATMMDPGSVVREGEQGMVRATQSASDQVKALVGMVSGGQSISPEARTNLLNQMNNRYQALKGQHDDLMKTFGDIAEREGMDRRNIAVPIPEVKYGNGAGAAIPPPPSGFRQIR